MTVPLDKRREYDSNWDSISFAKPTDDLHDPQCGHDGEKQSPFKIKLKFHEHRHTGKPKTDQGHCSNPNEMTGFNILPFLIQ